MSVHRRLAGVFIALLFALSPMLLPAQSYAAARPTCRASLSDYTPAQYSNVYVHIASNSGGAFVRTIAHYKTTNTQHTARTGPAGFATVRYYISGATPGYRVGIDVWVTKGGVTGHCFASFVPHR